MEVGPRSRRFPRRYTEADIALPAEVDKVKTAGAGEDPTKIFVKDLLANVSNWTRIINMTDPKFQELPVDAQGEFKEVDESTLTDEQRLELRKRRMKDGLSINHTIAANADRSVGSRGVDTSGIASGEGAGVADDEFDRDDN